MNKNTDFERMQEIEVFGVPALLTANHVSAEAVYPGMYRYELMAESQNTNRPQGLALEAGSRFLGTVLTPVPVPLMCQGVREFGPDDLLLDAGGGTYTPAEFEEKYLSPDKGRLARS